MNIKTVAVGNYTAAYREVGQGEAIVCLHGFLGDGSAWQAVTQMLGDRYRCLAPDLLGFGASSKPTLKYVIDHQVAFLHQFVTTLGLESFHLVGYSYGGWTAAAYGIALATQTLPHQASSTTLPHLRRLILVAPAGIRDDSFVGRYHHLRPLLWANPLVDVGLAALGPVARLLGKAEFYACACKARRTLMQQPVARSFLVDRLRPEDAIDTVEQAIHHIAVPTLIIAAAHDQTIPLWHCQVYRDRIPQACLEILPDAGHDLIRTHSQA
ncbi:MAG: alpha/beta hydrolase, partial [Cyanobacteria bacterium]|nr:alpha/beta hydrolase [Cyanobacteriota bacterium]MDW8203003.1 alpha/beta hydrolase [Cyanobacteriota bacterium SKYGB_h_bin112]